MNHDSDPMSASPTIRSPRSNRSPRDYRSPGRESPTRDRAYKSKSEKYIEDSIDDLRSQVVQCEAEIDHLKQAFRSKNRGKPSSVEGNFDEVNHHSLQRKVKKLAENTTKACGTLSAGLSDVQQATLNLYSWADKVHDSFQLVSDKLQLSSNICPRAKVYKPRGISAEGNY